MRVAGFGFRQGTGLESFRAALAGQRVDAVATLDSKAGALQVLGLPVIAVTRAQLLAHAQPGSARVMALYGTGSVAESAALAAAGGVLVWRNTSPDGRAVASWPGESYSLVPC